MEDLTTWVYRGRHAPCDDFLTRSAISTLKGPPRMFPLFRKWLSRAPRQRPDLHFLMYTREDCHLCAEAWDLLTRHKKLSGYSL